MQFIETRSLRLEPQVAAHAEEMFEVLSDPAIYEFENAPPPSLDWLRARFSRLEAGGSANGQERWFNWVIRLPTSALIGYVQATLYADGRNLIAYELASAHWGRGHARCAVEAVMTELAMRHGVRQLSAVLKRKNHRSLRLLERLGFAMVSPQEDARFEAEPDEIVMQRMIDAA